ncbi:DUF1232 domain-containing protein [Clostridium sp.]|uniref:YkvA family protein n=1 Tax=Clostridium sp. TaxID=1506 RepID=UPI00321755A3
MKISNIKVTITEKDLYSIITDVLKDYVEIEGLIIDKILIDKDIVITGSYKYKLVIPFSMNISIKNVENNILYLYIDKINVKNLKIFKGIINIALKAISSKVENFGIEFKEDIIKVKFDKICEIIPMIDFKMKDLSLIPYGLEAEVSDFNFQNEKDNKIDSNSNIGKTSIEGVKEDTINCRMNIESSKNEIEESKGYTYRKFRKELKERFSIKYKKMYPYVVLLPDIIALFMRLYKDKRVAKETKFNISIALTYLLFPLDIIPDTIPLLGKIDDLAVTFFILQNVLCDIPEEVVLDNWEGQANIIEVSREAMSLLNDKFGSKEIKKMVDIARISMRKTIGFFTK